MHQKMERLFHIYDIKNCCLWSGTLDANMVFDSGWILVFPCALQVPLLHYLFEIPSKLSLAKHYTASHEVSLHAVAVLFLVYYAAQYLSLTIICKKLRAWHNVQG
jgi:hypothetical protein